MQQLRGLPVSRRERPAIVRRRRPVPLLARSHWSIRTGTNT